MKLGLVQRLSISLLVQLIICAAPVIHCYIKPSNVLLDDDLVGRVDDFGLGRFLTKATDSSSTPQQSSSLIRGTIGYTAPEYRFGGEPTTYGDLYTLESLCWSCSPAEDQHR